MKLIGPSRNVIRKLNEQKKPNAGNESNLPRYYSVRTINEVVVGIEPETPSSIFPNALFIYAIAFILDTIRKSLIELAEV